MGSVLYVAAHPDDENTQLITYLARGRGYRTAYLSLTRGDGGQNVLGPEFGEELGVIRTQELLAARRLDGGRQFFTRAIDFGFSKDYRETLQIWDRQQVVSDIVRVIRTFQPDVIITRFSPQPGGTHGHHTASAVLAVEAFKLAGDTNAFPDQLRELTAWQPTRIMMNSRGGGADSVQMDVGGNDPVSGEPFGAIAGRSRAMHKTQGFGNFGGGGGGARSESFQLLAGKAAGKDILDGVDSSWRRLPGGAEVGTLAEEVIRKFDGEKPQASVDALLILRNKLHALGHSPLLEDKRTQLDRILQACLGLSVVTTIPRAEVVPGEQLKLHSTATILSKVPILWTIKGQESTPGVSLKAGEPVTQDLTLTLPTTAPLTQPYWLREPPSVGMFRVADPTLIGRPENPPPFPVVHLFDIAGQTLAVSTEPVQAGTESGSFEARRPLQVIPPVSLRCEHDVAVFAPGASREQTIEVVAARPQLRGELFLDAPPGWKVTPATQPFDLPSVGQRASVRFNITAPAEASTAQITARARIGSAVFDRQRFEIRYPHVPGQLLQPPAAFKALSFELATRGRNVGYLPGAGDSVAEAVAQMGYNVTMLSGAGLTTNRLKEFDAVVIGIRAFNVRTDLVSQLPALFAFIEAGGNVVVQYNRPGGDLKTERLAPYPVELSGDRITDENAPITFLAPDHPALNRPNKITQTDFQGWVQERGVYFPNQWDEHFTPILGSHDPRETELSGALLVAPYGKGHFVYTGLTFFRQLPAGVPGAYRLFANLVSLGK